MALDVYFKEDIAAVLGAIHIAASGPIVALEPQAATEQEQAVRDAYRAGFEDALAAVGAAVGIAPQRTLTDGRYVHTG